MTIYNSAKLRFPAVADYPRLMALLDGYMNGIFTKKDVMYRAVCFDPHEVPMQVADVCRDYLDGKYDNWSAVAAILDIMGMK